MEANFANWQRRHGANRDEAGEVGEGWRGWSKRVADVKKPRKSGKLVMTSDDISVLYDQIKHDKNTNIITNHQMIMFFINCDDDISRLAILIIWLHDIFRNA